MIELLKTFAALSLCASSVLAMLPSGSIRKTASMALGLLTLMCYLQGLMGLIPPELSVELPQSVLAPTSVSLMDAEDEAVSALEESP